MHLWELYKGKDYHIVPTLERIEKAVSHLGIKPSYPSIQVGGTNGKGSTCAFLHEILKEHGYKVGWFVSPHLQEERERWRIDGELIPDEKLARYVRELKPYFERFELTYFEACTLIALLYFEDKGVDVAVFEVGMGGRWDATKVCNPEVCVITNIQRDHIRWLGSDCESRAVEKLGIYRRGKPLVLGSMRFPLYTKALELCDIKDLSVAGIDFFCSGSVRGFKTWLEFYEDDRIRLEEVRLGLWGKYQADNASLAIRSAGYLIKLEEDKVKRALERTRWEGRMELLREKPLLILDGAHNPDGIRRAVKELKTHVGNITPVFTALKDKEWELSLSYLRELSDRLYLVRLKHHRGEDISRVYKKALELGFRDVHILDEAEAVLYLEEDLVVLGSLYLLGEVRKAFFDRHEGKVYR